MNPDGHPMVAYYRVSTAKQGTSGLGLEAQQKTVRDYAASRGMPLVAEFTEVESGTVRDRPELEKALALAARTHCPLVVAKLDRLARDAAFVLNLRAAGVEFIAVDMPHANRMLIGIMALVAEYEREQISERTKRALAAAKARGVVLGGWRGKDGESGEEITKRGRDTMSRNAELRRSRVAPMVKAALDLCGGNFNEAARQLNRSKVATPSGRGQWYAKQVSMFVERGEVTTDV